MSIIVLDRPIHRAQFDIGNPETWGREWREQVDAVRREYQTEHPLRVCSGVGTPSEVRPTERQIEGVISSEVPDFSKEIVIAGGMKIRDSGKVPILVAHDYGPDSMPVGRMLSSRIGKTRLSDRMLVHREIRGHEDSGTEEMPEDCPCVIALGQYHAKTDRARNLFELCADGMMTDLSIGFIPLAGADITDKEFSDNPNWRGARWKWTDWVLVEYSHVCVGDNPEAVVLMVQKARASGKPLDPWFTDFFAEAEKRNPVEEKKTIPIGVVLKPYPNEHACRVKDPGEFDRFARMTQEIRDGEFAGKKIDIIIGWKGEKSEVQAYRYSKDSWTPEDARKHCAGHKGNFEAAGKAAESCRIIDLGTVKKEKERVGIPWTIERRDRGLILSILENLDDLKDLRISPPASNPSFREIRGMKGSREVLAAIEFSREWGDMAALEFGKSKGAKISLTSCRNSGYCSGSSFESSISEADLAEKVSDQVKRLRGVVE